LPSTLGGIVLLFSAAFIAGLAWLRHAATLARGRGPLAPHTLSLKGASQIRPFKDWLQAMQAYALSLRQPERGYGTRLDARKTVDASARKAGLFAPVYGGARERRFLAFVRRESQQDHEAFMGEALIAELFRCGADVLAFRFDGDANVVEPYTPVLRDGQKAQANEQACFPTMDQVLAANEQAECLVFCEPLAMTNPVSGELADWSAKLVKRSPRCTVFSLGRSGPDNRAFALLDAAGARLSCFDAEALQSLGNAVQSTRTRTGRRAVMPRALALTIQLRRRRPPQSEVDALCGAIGEYMGATGLRWVQACAIYPDINWALTNAVGCALMPDEREREHLLFRLSQMVWFRHAYMPDWLRTELASKLSPTEQTWLREFYWELFDQRQGSNNMAISVAKGGLDFGGRMRRLLQRARARLGLRTALRSARDREQIYLRFLLGRPVSPLTMKIPQRIMAALSDAARTPRAALAALCMTGAAVSLLWVIAVWRSNATPLPSALTLSVGFGSSDERLIFGAAFGSDRLLVGTVDVLTGSVAASREIKRSVVGRDSEGVAAIPGASVISLEEGGVLVSDAEPGGTTYKYELKAQGNVRRWLAAAPVSAADALHVQVARLSSEKATFTDLFVLGKMAKEDSYHLLSDGRVETAQEFAFDHTSRLIFMRMYSGTAAIRLDGPKVRISYTTKAAVEDGKLLRVAAAKNYFAECWESGRVRLFRSDSFTVRFERNIGSGSPCTALAIRPEGEQLAVGTANGLVVMLGSADVQIDKVPTSYGGQAAVASIAFAPSFKRMAIARSDLSVSIVDLTPVEQAPAAETPAADSAAAFAASAASAASAAASAASAPSGAAPAASAAPVPEADVAPPPASGAAPATTPVETGATVSGSTPPRKGYDRVPVKRNPTSQQDADSSSSDSHFGDADPAQSGIAASSRVKRAAKKAAPSPVTEESGNDTAAQQALPPSADILRNKAETKEIPQRLDKK
jgi:hypothetical protein